MKIDKKAVAGALALLMLSWAAFPVLYIMLAKKNMEVEKKNDNEKRRKNIEIKEE